MTEREALETVIKAWDALPTGYYPPAVICAWLEDQMKPAIDRAREACADGETAEDKK